MGKTDKYIMPIYKKIARNYTDNGSVVGMFGFTDSDKQTKFWRKMDFYDLRLSNWDINGDWAEGKTYKTIVCLRTSCFARNVHNLLASFYARLKPGGTLFIDWSLGSGHYWRDTKVQSWGWSLGEKRSFGTYSDKKCFLYSSCLTDKCLASDAFRQLCDCAKHWSHYSDVGIWRGQVISEFGENELARTDDISKYFDVIYERSWTPLNKNGRFQLYIIQVLKKC